MKKLLLISFLFTITLCAFSQITGKFTGNPTFFVGTNTTNSDLSITVYAINEAKNQSLKWSFVSYAGNTFSIGQNNGWVWEFGEKLVIKYSNGYTVYWVNNRSYTPSFTGNAGKYCTGDRHSCTCSGYEPYSRADWHCKNCGHPKNYHKAYM